MRWAYPQRIFSPFVNELWKNIALENAQQHCFFSTLHTQRDRKNNLETIKYQP
jgi:hypothetical protein